MLLACSMLTICVFFGSRFERVLDVLLQLVCSLLCVHVVFLDSWCFEAVKGTPSPILHKTLENDPFQTLFRSKKHWIILIPCCCLLLLTPLATQKIFATFPNKCPYIASIFPTPFHQDTPADYPPPVSSRNSSRLLPLRVTLPDGCFSRDFPAIAVASNLSPSLNQQESRMDILPRPFTNDGWAEGTCYTIDSFSKIDQNELRLVPIGSMGLVYLPTWMVDLYGKCR